jgi:hypothetical protein
VVGYPWQGQHRWGQQLPGFSYRQGFLTFVLCAFVLCGVAGAQPLRVFREL